MPLDERGHYERLERTDSLTLNSFRLCASGTLSFMPEWICMCASQCRCCRVCVCAQKHKRRGPGVSTRQGVRARGGGGGAGRAAGGGGEGHARQAGIPARGGLTSAATGGTRRDLKRASLPHSLHLGGHGALGHCLRSQPVLHVRGAEVRHWPRLRRDRVRASADLRACGLDRAVVTRRLTCYRRKRPAAR